MYQGKSLYEMVTGRRNQECRASGRRLRLGRLPRGRRRRDRKRIGNYAQRAESPCQHFAKMPAAKNCAAMVAITNTPDSPALRFRVRSSRFSSFQTAGRFHRFVFRNKDSQHFRNLVPKSNDIRCLSVHLQYLIHKEY